jgi:AraC-like DNA-binding protein/quercetin dioxygenase-like cupin family protein
MPDRFVPITFGAPEHAGLEFAGFRVIEVRFLPEQYLPPHEHEWASIAVMLEGSFDLRMRGRTYSCPPSTAFTEPAGDRHANRMQRAGAHLLVVQVDPAHYEPLRPYAGLIGSMHHLPRAPVSRYARSVAGELAAPDDVTPLSVEGLVLEFLATLARSLDGRERHPPPWLVRVEDMLHERFRESLRVQEIAAEVNVHPAYLMRVFRERHRTTLGGYVRQLRIQWAAERVLCTDQPLAAIAHAAGFADQSHFTRLFRRHTGRTPARYRAARTKH